MATYLDRILEHHRARAADDPRSVDELVDRARELGSTRGFRDALRHEAGMSVIAEIKRQSPSKGPLRLDLHAAGLAQSYLAGGATCLSVLTDEKFFTGSHDDLHAANRAVPIPVLRKDFTVDPRDVCDARIMGADCVLLIVAALDQSELRSFHQLATEVGLDALVEVHDEAELERAADVGATLIGVNQRDLATFEVDTDRAERVVGQMPDGVVAVAESGIHDASDMHRLHDAGFDGALIGEALVMSDDPVSLLTALRS